MSKGKSITLLSIISVLLAIVLVLTFAQFRLDKAGIKSYASLLGAIELDYDLEGGTAYTLTLADDNEEEVTDINAVIDTLSYRMDQLGYGAYTIKAVKSTDKDVLDYDIRIEAKANDTLASDISVVSAYGTLNFYGGSSANPTDEILTDVQVIKNAVYNGASIGSDGESTVYSVTLEFTEQGYDQLMELIESAESSYYLEIKLGDTVLLSGSSAISASYFQNKNLIVTSQSESSARQMALQMKSGGLAYKYDVTGGEKITSPYGDKVALKCCVAILSLVILTAVLMFLAYRGFGLVTALSLLVFILGEGWLLIGVPGIVLSIGGVIGIILATVLFALSASILANRMKHEFVNSKKTAKASIKKAFAQALVPTISVNVVAGAVAIGLLAFASGVIKNFAVTFGIGVAVSLFTALVITRMFSVLIFAIVKNKEKFIGFKKQIKAEEE
ncbi:MAG: hypothetical protein J6U92_05115 [Clostridia bacterium]|nr:hypothetical protein [Clostridia bacterium]